MDEFLITAHQSTEKQALADQMRREMTPQERRLWQHLRAGKLNGLHFRRQQIVDGFIADFYCYKARLIVEVDGRVHDMQSEYDAERDAILTARSLHLLRITNTDIDTQILTVLARIKAAANMKAPL